MHRSQATHRVLAAAATLSFTLGGLSVSADGAPITGATFNLDPGSIAADTDQNGWVDQPLSFTSITVDGVTYSQFTYGTSTDASAVNRYYTPGDDPGSHAAAMSNTYVTDGLASVHEGWIVMFSRAITSDDRIVLTDLDLASNIDHTEDFALYLVDENGDDITGTGTAFQNIGDGGGNLLSFEVTGGVVGNAHLYGSAFALDDFNGSLNGSTAYGVRVGSTRSADPSLIALATVPEPASLTLLAPAALVLLRSRRRRG